MENQVCEFHAIWLLPAQDLKALVVDIWGAGAISLGTIAVERAWWPVHVRNVNRTVLFCALAGFCLHNRSL